MREVPVFSEDIMAMFLSGVPQLGFAPTFLVISRLADDHPAHTHI